MSAKESLKVYVHRRSALVDTLASLADSLMRRSADLLAEGRSTDARQAKLRKSFVELAGVIEAGEQALAVVAPDEQSPIPGLVAQLRDQVEEAEGQAAAIVRTHLARSLPINPPKPQPAQDYEFLRTLAATMRGRR